MRSVDYKICLCGRILYVWEARKAISLENCFEQPVITGAGLYQRDIMIFKATAIQLWKIVGSIFFGSDTEKYWVSQEK